MTPHSTAIVLITVMGVLCVLLAYEWRKEPGRVWLHLILASLLLLLFGLSVHPARAQHNGHRPQDQELHTRFYNSWMMPDNRSVSCCHEKDCRPAQAYQRNGQWYARQEGDEGDFTPVPPQKVEFDRDTPDGRNHLCGQRYGFSGGQFSVFCFIAGSGG